MNQLTKALRCLPWVPTYGLQRLNRRMPDSGPIHLIFSIADHFEPSFNPEDPQSFVDYREQERRVSRWCDLLPKAMQSWRDSEGIPFRHTYFYPGEQYNERLLATLASHCQEGWGEIEVHLHHGKENPDTAQNTRRVLEEFRDTLVRHGALSRFTGETRPRYAFVHGDWALANSNSGRNCGVDEEMQILSETGCVADFTLPSAPDPSQIAKINSIYECTLPLDQRSPHRRGRDLSAGSLPEKFPVIVQGPLGINFKSMKGLPFPRIENGAITSVYPPSMERFDFWRHSCISVAGRPEWIFIKLHCHGMDPRDEEAMFGDLMQSFLKELTEWSRKNRKYRLHFTTAREMLNIILAACEGREGNPALFRDYLLKLITPQRPSW